MGHSRAGARGHYDYDEYTIKEAYAKAFEHLSINGAQSREDIAQLKTSVTETKKEMEELKLENLQTKYALDLLIKKLDSKGIKIDINAMVEEEDRKYNDYREEEESQRDIE